MKRTILVVEDNPEERGIFSAYLEFTGARLVQATNGAEGLAAALEHAPDIILLDLSMPVMDGWELMHRLQADEASRGIPVLAITGYHLSPERLAAAGFCGYLEKPLAPYEVLAEIERCIGSLGDDVEPQGPMEIAEPPVPGFQPSSVAPPAPGPGAGPA